MNSLTSFLKTAAIIIACFIGINLLLLEVVEIIDWWNRIHVKDEFYIEYLEMYNSNSLWNGAQVFVGSVKEAYWNNDSLVVAGKNECFLIEFGKTKYNDEMVKIDCIDLKNILKNKPLEKYIRE